MIEAVASTMLIGAGTFLLLEQATLARRRVHAQLQRVGAPVDDATGRREGVLAQGLRDRVVRPGVRRLAALAVRLSPGYGRAMLRRRLQMAGVTVDPQAFLAAKAALPLVMLGAGAVAASMGHPAAMAASVPVAISLFKAPDAWLTLRQRRRRREIDHELPDMLDLLTVSVEAGLGFDAAVLKVTQKLDGPLADELRILLHEIRLGSTRGEALRTMGERCGSSEVATFARALLQAEALGVAIGPTLRIQSGELRARRQLAAEEQAMKAPVKMMFPTVVFIFPAMFIVVVAPAFMSIIETFTG